MTAYYCVRGSALLGPLLPSSLTPSFKFLLEKG